MDPKITSYLAKKYGYSDDLSDAALKASQDQSKDAQFQTNLGRAGATIGAALSGTKPDTGFYDELNQQARSQVNDLMTRRKAQSDNLAFQNSQINHQQMQDTHDPTSNESQVLRKTWEKALPGIDQAYGEDWQHVTAADKDLILKPLEFKEQLNSRKDMKSMMFQQHQNENYNKSMSETVDKIEQSKLRGAVKNAWEAERLVNNAKDIMTAYPDLNQMPHQQVALLVDELGKIARGGAATEGSQHSLMPNTVTSSFMSGLSRLGNSPQGAQVGDFLKNYGSYLEDLRTNAKTMIGQHVKSTLMGYKNRLRPEDHETIRQNYSDYLQDQPTPKSIAKPAQGRIRVSNGKEILDILPDDIVHAQKEGFQVVGS